MHQLTAAHRWRRSSHELRRYASSSSKSTNHYPVHGAAPRMSAYRPRMQPRDRVRAFARSLPEAIEDVPWGESAAKVNGNVFVFLGAESSPGPRRMTVKLDESHGHALSLEGAEPTGYGLGKSGWVTLPLRAPGV